MTSEQQRLEAAQSALRQYSPAPSDVAKARVRASIKAKLNAGRAQRRSDGWLAPALVLAVATLVAVSTIRFSERMEPPTWQTAEKPKTHAFKNEYTSTTDAKAVFEPGAVYQTVDGVRKVQLSEGTVHMEGENFALETRHAFIKPCHDGPGPYFDNVGVRSTFKLIATERETFIEVIAGSVHVTPQHRAQKTILRAGQRARILPTPQARKLRKARTKTPITLENRDTLERGRRALSTNAPSAARAARDVLETKPSPKIEAEALALLADAERRSDRLKEAAQLYDRLSRHPEATQYGEEALLRLARIQRRLGAPQAALQALAQAHKRYPNGPLELARAALAVDLHMGLRDLEKAEAALPDSARGHSIALQNSYVKLGCALATRAPARSRALLERALGSTMPAPLTEKAKNCLEKMKVP